MGHEHAIESPLLGLSQRMPPQNILAEQSLLGAIMANPKALDRVAAFLRPEHFADPIHGRIYRKQTRLILAGGIADAVRLKTVFENGGALEEVGGVKYLAQLLSSMVSVINAGDYGQVIRDCWVRRQMIDVGENLVNGAFYPGEGVSAGDVLTIASAGLDALATSRSTERPIVELDDAVDAAIRAADDAAKRGGPIGLSTGMPSVDQVLGGLEPSTLTILAGRPGMGKSALGWQWAINGARQMRRAREANAADEGVVGISLEMSALSLGRRALSAASGVPSRSLQLGQLTSEQAWLIESARKEMRGLPLSIIEEGGLGISALRIKLRQASRKRRIGLIVVDHLHLIPPDETGSRNQNGTYEVGKVALGLLNMAKEFEAPVVALAQLSRGVETRDDKRPVKSDLRQAGELEQNADNIAFVYRPEYYLPTSPPDRTGRMSDEDYQKARNQWHAQRDELAGKAELILAKVRGGEEKTVPLRFHGATTSFTEIASMFDEPAAQGELA